jgi:DNA-binding MurR/RpiR family transcriptional regulator
MTRLLTEALADFAPAGPAEARVAAFLAENRHQLAAMSLDEIAAAVGVSQPTVTRTIARLG